MAKVRQMTFSFHPEAEEEFNKAIDYYEDIEPGLGYDFALEVYSTVRRSVEFPKAWAVLEGGIRRSLVRRFPYGVLYSKEQEEIFVVAVMNLHREPDYWKHRK
jgi:plasmid stabilization system protein ParE